MAKLQVSIRNNKAYAHSLTDVVFTPTGETAENRYKYLAQQDAIRNTLNNPAFAGSSFGKGVNLIHFSDIHGDGINLGKIVAFKEAFPVPIEALFTGDMVFDSWSDGIAFWENTEGAENIMVAIGNHDSRTLSGGYWAKTASECYARYIEPFVSNWGVTSGSGVCYYYKDYASKNLRLVVVDYMHWDATQKSWLEATLASAKTAGYHVVAAGHAAPAYSDSGIRTCSFDTIGAPNRSWEDGGGFGKMDEEIPEAVQDFIDGGGNFACWLCGHTHADMFRHLTSYPNQLYIAVGQAGAMEHGLSTAGGLAVRVIGEKNEEQFNLVSISAPKRTVTVIRVGADYDTIGRHIGTVVYDYANHTILWND